jgi:prepilin-type processing-associated H-X9-DG protein
MAEERNTGQQAEARLKRGMRCLVDVLVVLFILVGLATFLLPRVGGGESPTRTRCHQNLKSIGLAIHAYGTKYGHLPPAYTVDKQGHRMHSWRVLILEFLNADLYTKYDLSQPWNSPANLALAKEMKKDSPYHCISETPEDASWTSYVMLVGPTAISNGPLGRKCQEITDGVSNTVMVVEMSPSGILWTAPYDLNVAEMSFRLNDPSRACVRSRHSNGANVLFADGSVRYFSAGDRSKDAEAHLKALVTVNGGEDMTTFKDR